MNQAKETTANHITSTAVWGLFWCALLIGYTAFSTAHAATSTRVYLENDKLSYTSDAEGNRVPDFSHAGYNGEGFNPDGTLNLPNFPAVPVGNGLSPLGGGADDGPQINAAIQALAGTGGVVQLEAGTFTIVTPIELGLDNVLLRGRGKDQTFLDGQALFDPAVSTRERSIIRMGGGYDGAPWVMEASDPIANIISEFVPVGSRSFEVDSSAGFAVGDNIIVAHPATHEWLESIGYGETIDGRKWLISGASYPSGVDDPLQATLPTSQFDITGLGGSSRETILYNRRIVDINDSDADGAIGIVLDAPLFNHIDLRIYDAGSPAIKPYIYKFTRAETRVEQGVEDLAVLIDPTASDPQNPTHTPADNAISMLKIENSFVNNVQAEGFKVAAVLTRNASQLTIANTDAINPAGAPENGGDRYHFNAQKATSNVLFVNCHAEFARHAYIAANANATGIVVLDSTQSHSSIASEGHLKWVNGMLFDNLISSDPEPGNLHKLAFFNRPVSNHGWGAVNSVMWNAAVVPGSRILIQKPPTAQNYCFGCGGNVTDENADPKETRNAQLLPGVMEASNDTMDINSLYREQLRVRQEYGAPPSAPAALVAVEDENNPGEVALTWLDVAEAETTYSVERAENGGAFAEVASLAANSTSYTDTGATTNADAVYRVRAMSANGHQSAYSNPSDAVTVGDPGNGGGGNETLVKFVTVKTNGSFSSSAGIGIRELRVFDQNGDNVAPAASGIDTSSARNRYPEGNVNDNSSSSRWRSKKLSKDPLPSVTLELSTAVDASSVQVYWGVRYSNDYEVALYDENNQLITTFSGDAGRNSTDTFTVE